jgi:hypothetical protein
MGRGVWALAAAGLPARRAQRGEGAWKRAALWTRVGVGWIDPWQPCLNLVNGGRGAAGIGALHTVKRRDGGVLAREGVLVFDRRGSIQGPGTAYKHSNRGRGDTDEASGFQLRGALISGGCDKIRPAISDINWHATSTWNGPPRGPRSPIEPEAVRRVMDGGMRAAKKEAPPTTTGRMALRDGSSGVLVRTGAGHRTR